MNALFLLGSSRGDGNTARTIRLFREKLEQACAERGVSLDVEEISLARPRLEFCLGCRACFDRGEDYCPLKDGLLGIRDKMLWADTLVIASPVYVEDVSGHVKNWIDRLAFLCHRPALYSKCAWLITTSGSRSTKHTLRTMSVALTTWGVKVLGGNKLFLGALSEKEKIEEKYGPALEKAAGRLLRATQSGASADPTLFSLLAFRVQQGFWRRDSSDSFDRRYWADKGWLEVDCDYYMPHRAGVTKRVLSRLASKAVLAVFK